MSEQKFRSYDPEHSLKDVTDLSEKLLGEKVRKIDRKDLGEVNVVYFIESEDTTEYVMKVSPKVRNNNSFEQEAWAYQELRKHHIPVPEVITVDTTSQIFPEAYLLMRKMQGVPFNKAKPSEAEKKSISEQLGQYLYLMHQISLPRFGWLDMVDGKPVGKANSYWEYIVEELSAGWWIEDFRKNKYLSEASIDDVRKLFDQNKSLFALDQASLVHTDATSNNILVKGGRITSILDMENIMASDPVVDFVWIDYWNYEQSYDLQVLKNGYGNQGLFDENFERKVLLYQMLFGLSLVGYFTGRQDKEGLEYSANKFKSDMEKFKK
jgi:aminoglycoside phosphotransferase (APT) family kinase protein